MKPGKQHNSKVKDRKLSSKSRKSKKKRSSSLSLLAPDAIGSPERVKQQNVLENGAQKSKTKGQTRNSKLGKEKRSISKVKRRPQNVKLSKAKKQKPREKATSSDELVTATVQYVHRMCLSPDEKTSGKYFTRSEIEARAKLREDFRLRMQNVRDSIKKATKGRRKKLKRKLSQIRADQEMIMSMNRSSKGSVVESVYGPEANTVSNLQVLKFLSPREGMNQDISTMLLAGGASHRPKSRSLNLAKESDYFASRPEKWSPRRQARKKMMGRHSAATSNSFTITNNDFEAMYGTLAKSYDKSERKTQTRPYFVEHMALTAEEKKGRLLFLKDYERKRRLQREAMKEEAERSAAIEAGLDPDAIEMEKKERDLQEAEAEKEQARLAHVGKRPWDYSGVPVLPNTTARFSDDSSEDLTDESNSDGDATEDDSDLRYTRQRNDAELLRSIFPRPNAVTRRLWSKHGYRFHSLQKEQQMRAYKREKQIYLLEEASKALEEIQEKIQALENYRVECGISDIQRAAKAEQSIIDAMLGLKMSASSLTDESLVDSTEKFCTLLETARPEPGEAGSGKILHEYAEKVDAFLSEFAMCITEGLAADPDDIDWNVMNEELQDLKKKMDGKGTKSLLGQRNMGLANLTRTFALERGVLEKVIASCQEEAALLQTEIEHEDQLDRERLADAKKRYHSTPYLSGQREKKPPNHKCWVCKAKIKFPKTKEGALFTFCGECNAFNQNPGAPALVTNKDARNDPKVRKKQKDLIDGVNNVIHTIGQATAQGQTIHRGTWGVFDKIQRQAALPTKEVGLGPGYYDIRKNERKIGHVPRIRAALIADPSVLERELAK